MKRRLTFDEARLRRKVVLITWPLILGHHSHAYNQSANMLISLNFLLFNRHSLIVSCPLQIKKYIACLAVNNRPRSKRENSQKPRQNLHCKLTFPQSISLSTPQPPYSMSVSYRKSQDLTQQSPIGNLPLQNQSPVSRRERYWYFQAIDVREFCKLLDF